VAAQNGDTLALSNGCVCCTIGDDLSSALIRVLDAQPPFDAVMIEASGVSDPGRIARLAKAAPELQADAVLVLIDASMLLEQVADPLLSDTLRRQLQAADLLVLNKVDLVSGNTLEQVRRHIHNEVPGTPLLESVQCRLPFELVSSQGLKNFDHHNEEVRHSASFFGEVIGADTTADAPEAAYRPYRSSWTDHTDIFESWSGKPHGIRSRTQWEQALGSLIGQVLRLKGWVWSTDQGALEVQLAGRQLRLKALQQLPQQDTAELVAIGVRGRLPLNALNTI